MPAINVLSRVATGCVLTMLLPASQSLALSVSPRFDPCSMTPERSGTYLLVDSRELFPPSVEASTGSVETSFVSLREMGWCGGDFVPFEANGSGRTEATIEAPAPADQIPGAVMNLRRGDQH